MLTKVPESGPTTILAPDGSVATKATRMLTAEEAEILRAYKKFLAKYGLQEALFCTTCGRSTREDGCRAYVQDGKILIECRCTARLYLGQSF